MKRLAALAAVKLSLCLREQAGEELFGRYRRILDPAVTEAEAADYPELPEELFFDEPETALRYRRVYDLCRGDAVALAAVQLCLLAELEPRLPSLLREALGLELGVQAAGRIACRGVELPDLAPRLRTALDRVEILLRTENGVFHPDGRLSAFLKGDSRLDRGLSARGAMVWSGKEELPPAVLTGALAEETAGRLASAPGFVLLHISGEPSSGRRFFARHVAGRLGYDVLEVPFDAVGQDESLWRRMLRELLLEERRTLCLHGLDCPAERRQTEMPPLLRRLEREFAPFGRPVFLTTEPGVKVLPFVGCPVCPVSIPRPGLSESVALWNALAEQELPGRDFPAESLAAKMTLTAGQMERILRLLRIQNPQGPWTEREIFRLCYQVLDDGRYENIRFVETSFTWEDLRLEPALKTALEAVCVQVERQRLVLDGWGLRRRYPYGRSVSVLFSGPPGTGKTMAAQVLASRLGLELYKVDLSQIVDKYIGETEKRLGQIFDQAEKSNLVLFFDEADALLGKRSEVKDSKDKYANVEAAYLLQRIEEYQGVVLMATNQAGSMDPAFLRRFRYHLVFTLPDEAMRRRLWEDALSGIPAEGVNLDYLARQFQLSGAQIKNIALNAAYRAAEGGALHMEHIVLAVRQELQKEGKVLLASDFGEYGYFLQ